MLSFEELSAIAPQQVCLSIAQSDLNATDDAMRHTQYSNESARQQAYYNLLSLQLVKQWIADFLDESEIHPWLPEAELSTVWDVVNGSLLQVGNSRLVLIPNGDRPFDELSVPQEWVDHPDWCGDYYLAVDINLEQRWLRIAGYTTYARLKQSWFDDIDRTYCLPVDALIEDLNVLWVGRELMPNPTPRVSALPPIGSQTAERLIEQLSAVKDYSPRLDVPFGQWAMLVTHSSYRQALYHRRIGRNVVHHVSNWLQRMMACGWNQMSLESAAELHRFSVASAKSVAPEADPDAPLHITKEITLAQATVTLSIVRELMDSRISVMIGATLSTNPSTGTPLRLVVLDQQGSAFMTKTMDSDADSLQLTRFFVTPDETFSIRVELGGEYAVENISAAQ
jgi:hypothetical protein